MPERQRETRLRALLRFAGIILAVGLTVAAAWMISLGHSQREVQLGVILGLWAALIGAMTFYSGRHSGPMVSAGGNGGGSSEVELRQNFAVEMQREVSARRAYEQQLHEMVRREIETIQRVVGDQLGKLRDDVASLRGDLVDQVGGKIRLERIETTRVIGSDIEALQNEVRQLAGVRPPDHSDRTRSAPEAPSRVFEAAAVRRTDEPAVTVARPAAIHPDQPAAATTAAAQAPAAQPASGQLPATPAPVAASIPPMPAPPAYQPYVAPTYAPAVTYAAGSSSDPNEPGRPVPLYSAPAPGPSVRAASLDGPPAASAPVPPPQSLSPQSLSPQSAQPRSSAPQSVPTFIPSTPLPSLQVPPLPPAERPINGGSAYNGSANGASPNGASANGASANGASANGGPGYYGSSSSDDPFAAMPRLTRFDDTDDGDLARPNGVAYSPSDSPWSQPPASPPLPVPAARRHGAPEEAQSPAPEAESGGGRRRRADGETNDVLARLLNNQ